MWVRGTARRRAAELGRARGAGRGSGGIAPVRDGVLPVRAGVRAADASATADVLVLADARGHPSHGVSRLRQYLRLVDSGSVSGRPAITVLERRAATELWDADHALGPAVAHRAMARAIVRARRTGIAAVVVREAGHFGIAGAYALHAMDAGLCAIATCNGTPIIPPTGARAPGAGHQPDRDRRSGR